MLKRFKLKDMKKGWFVGDFDKAALRTSRCEVSYQVKKAGDSITPHYHRIGKEVTLIIRGVEVVNGEVFRAGDIFVIDPYVVSEAKILEDVELVVVRTYSDPDDKVCVEPDKIHSTSLPPKPEFIYSDGTKDVENPIKSKGVKVPGFVPGI